MKLTLVRFNRDLFMKRNTNIFLSFFMLFVLSIPVSNTVASEINDSAALKDIKEAKSVFLIDFTNPKKTAFYLKIIEGTYKGLEKQNVKSDMVLVFIGKTVQYLSTKPGDDLELEFDEELTSIQNSIKAFSKLGVRMEVCAVATKVFNVDNKTIPKEMNIVADGFVSLIGWQTQGHKLVPIF